MDTKFVVVKNTYKDADTLLKMAASLLQIDGVEKCFVNMATEADLAFLAQKGFDARDLSLSRHDLLLCLQTRTIQAQRLAKNTFSALLKQNSSASQYHQLSTLSQAHSLSNANFALISIDSEFALAESYKALNLGMNVMLFSHIIDPIEERAIKLHAQKHNLIVLGPNCTSAILDGIPLAFACEVEQGNIAVVSTLNRALQEASVIIDSLGGGISQAIAVGEQDLSNEVGGISTLDVLRRLVNDANTEVILLIAALPSSLIIEKILSQLQTSNKATVLYFFGANKALVFEPQHLHKATELYEAARLSTELAGISAEAYLQQQARQQAPLLQPSSPIQQYLRALLPGKGFCYQALVLGEQKNLDLYSNAPINQTHRLERLAQSQAHTVLDLSDPLLTKGRAHPLLDPSFRDERLLQEASDPQTAVIVVSVVLGYGVHSKSLANLVKAIAKAKMIAKAARRELPIIVPLCATKKDITQKENEIAQLKQAGAIIASSTLEAIKMALQIVEANNNVA